MDRSFSALLDRRDAAEDQIHAAFRLELIGCRIGGHFYPRAPRLTSSCVFGCGCWMGPSRSGVAGVREGEPTELDQFGPCPLAPVVPPPVWRRIATWPIVA